MISLANVALSGEERQAEARDTRKTIALMGVTIDSLTEVEVVQWIINAIENGYGGWVITPNVDQLRILHKQPEVRQMVADASLMVADGMPLIWASRLQGTPLPERVAGSSLIISLSSAAARIGARVMLLGGSPGAGTQAAAVLRRANPGLRICGVVCPPMGFEKDPVAMRSVRSAVTGAQPDIVYTCFGFPKQELIISELRKGLPSTWFLGLGGSFSIVGGHVSRAPRWLQRIGLEWSWRLAMEPKRLFRRYILDDAPFAVVLLCSALAARLAAG